MQHRLSVWTQLTVDRKEQQIGPQYLLPTAEGSDVGAGSEPKRDNARINLGIALLMLSGLEGFLLDDWYEGRHGK
jgi:hypothetical protein